ncbi:MAG: LytR C-terminal domain-containing protein [Candidatus Cloacimonetes bacterium]|nr:LytR C-terminal domain-containing protein [Candidatus Cloacimonadota bacterium]
MKRPKNKLSLAGKIAIIAVFVIIMIVIVIFFPKIYRSVCPGEPKPEPEFTSVKVTLLNGCGYDNVAQEVKEYLLRNNIRNIDIVSWRNVPRDMFIYEKSIIVARKDNPQKLAFLMNLTGIRRRILAWSDDYIEEFQIILGRDYRQYFAVR